MANRRKAIDLFSGAGGFSTGAAQAGVDVVWAANHWPEAVAAHAANHADTIHACQDLQQADFTTVPEHDLMLASPCCQGHTNARGGERGGHDDSRSTAWAVIAAADVNRPRDLIVENVQEFVTQWELYGAWRMTLEAMGYAVTENLIDAADAGVPQNRKRMFIVCSQDGPHTVELQPVEHAPARGIIAWDSGPWVPTSTPARVALGLKPLCARTLGQVAHAELHGRRQFLAPTNKSGSGKISRDIDRPIGAVTTKDRWRVCDLDTDRSRMLTAAEYAAAMGFPAGYELHRTKQDSIKLLGNAVCPPVARAVVDSLINRN